MMLAGSHVMSRAFVNEDAGQWGNPARRFNLPDRDDPGFDKAAAEAMLEAARDGDTGSAEMATGYYWGEERLKPYVREILSHLDEDEDERMVQLAKRFLR
ncbi:MAG TPA: hypothetical protein VKO87_00135 [Gemmatimonadaceae bacterium]|nr:hypothetical protein [Gemmatimonadaceae bacterium]